MNTRPNPQHLYAAIRAIPGVTEVFPPASQPSHRPATDADLDAPTCGRPDPLEMTVTPHSSTITATIGTAPDHPAPEIARQVADMLLAAATPATTVTVQIARIA